MGYRFLCFRSFNYTVDFRLWVGQISLSFNYRRKENKRVLSIRGAYRPAESDKECFDQCQRLFHVGGNAKSQAKMSRDITQFTVSHGTSSAENTCFLSV